MSAVSVTNIRYGCVCACVCLCVPVFSCVCKHFTLRRAISQGSSRQQNTVSWPLSISVLFEESERKRTTAWWWPDVCKHSFGEGLWHSGGGSLALAAVNRSIDIFTPCQLSVQHSGKSLQSEVRFSEEGQKHAVAQFWQEIVKHFPKER